MSLVHVVAFCFWADWSVRGVLKISAILQNYPTFFGKKTTKLEFLYIIGSALKSVKTLNLGLWVKTG